MELFFQTMWRLLRDYRGDIWDAFLLTVQLSVICEIAALALGLIVGIARLKGNLMVRSVAAGYVEFFRDTPFLVQLFWFYFAMPALGLTLDNYTTALVAVTLYIGSYKAEIFRAGIQAVPSGQMMAARGLGMPYNLAMRRIIVPQAVRKMIPPFMSSFINLIKSTSFCSTIGVTELTFKGYYIAETTFHSMEVLTAIAIIYFMLIYPMNLWVARLEVRLATRD
ncbi:MAG: amino acid ABC transporter permease [Rhodospirillales bacterium]|nr:amino acid ABC transporter permease [Rhodospirillales bacterium]